MLIEVAISGSRNVTKKEAKKILKYFDLIMEIRHMWNVRATVIPVIIGVIGTILKSLRQYLTSKSGRREIKDLHKQPYWALHTYFGTY